MMRMMNHLEVELRKMLVVLLFFLVEFRRMKLI